ncbi:hypothetical protein [Bradyrhizobium sp. BRP56]|uniref:hypothetical protein n=1 Tax=Bradyrhizobium sp. BRP56 TaxID=2793819 RepID=UPI001CD7AA01|nr:hypothetical protein [Bradyrhizobium sp. BRP56]MCA1402736.1 hypothetical protein [Bradyrhizobium sp. BRP56]
MDAPHRSDRNEAWLKVKTVRRASFWLSDLSKATSFAATNLGKQEGKKMIHVGKVATG